MPNLESGVNAPRVGGRARKLLERPWATRAILAAGIIVYLLLFEWMYREMISPSWGYLGFSYQTPSTLATVIGWVGSLPPLLWMPITIRRPSQAIYWLLYLTVYIPSMLAPYYLGLQPVSELLIVSIYFFVGFALINLGFQLPLPKPIRFQLSPRQFWTAFWVLYVCFTAMFILAYGNSLRLVSFADRNELRLATRQMDAGAFATYSRSWLAFCLNPFLLAMGFLQRRPSLFLLGAAGGVLLYSSAAARAWLVGIVYIPILYYALRGRTKGRSFGLRLTLFTSSIFLLSTILHLSGSIFAAAIWEPFVLRNHMNAGVLTGYYSEFFAANPLTYASQVTGVSWIVNYPYSMPIQFFMGERIAGTSEISANAHVWADGIASFGPVGVLIFSVLLVMVFYVLDFCCQHVDSVKAALLISVHFANLSNVALATSLVGGGFGLSIVMLMLMPPSILERRHAAPRRWSLLKFISRTFHFLTKGAYRSQRRVPVPL